MPTMRCGVAAVEALRAVGVTTIFGLMGSSTLEIYDALYDATDFTYIGVRHENCGMHMADAYGRVTQTPGVFICGQAGPGAANMVLGLAQAKLAYAPVVVLTGLPATEHLGRDTFQEIDQHVLFQPVTKRTFSVPRLERIPEFILEAFRVANTGRRGPVVVNIPRDLFNHEIDVMLPAAGGQQVVASGAVDSAALVGARVLSPHFDEVMKLCGGNGYLATEPGDTAEAVHQAMQDGKPAVIHVKVDPDAVLSFRRDALQKRG